MKTKQVFFVIFIIFTSTLNTIQAHCSSKALQSPKARNCGVIDGKLRSFNDSWKTNDCQQCSCQRSGISCCSYVF
ncbi:unnamed protein product [Rotaria socialis]|uniref:Uncharacterized protein n=1 Tax=Rotaria socialis TaxID=392032 RepID=A0A818MZI6_9BILA|nr:unnamed protein product [Rotaria socialis]